MSQLTEERSPQARPAIHRRLRDDRLPDPQRGRRSTAERLVEPLPHVCSYRVGHSAGRHQSLRGTDQFRVPSTVADAADRQPARPPLARRDDRSAVPMDRRGRLPHRFDAEGKDVLDVGIWGE